MKRKSTLKIILLILLFAFLIIAPQVSKSGYVINALIDATRWTVFALAFDLIAGQVGQVSLGQSVFFGLGAYLTSLVGSKYGFGWFGSIVFSAILMGILALFVGIAFFRIRHVTFAIGTLGFAMIAQMVVNSAVDITGGSLCSLGIKRPLISIPFTDIVLKITKPYQYYYLLLPIATVLLILIWAVNRSRTGRAFIAVREDEIRAAAIGINPLKYKLIAFALSGFVIGALGSFQAQYLTVVCPSEMGQEITNTLMIMVFVGGVGKMRGVIIGAIIFSVLPRFLEAGGERAITPQIQQIVYGLILILVTLYLPDGLDGFISRVEKKIKNLKNSPSEAGS